MKTGKTATAYGIPANISGRWEGALLDVMGIQAGLVMNLIDKNGALKGDFSIYFHSHGRGECGPVKSKLAQTGPIKGKFDSKTGRLVLKSEISVMGKPVVVDYQACIENADPHALHALVGTYKVEGGGPLTLEGGGVLLWLFRGFKKEGN